MDNEDLEAWVKYFRLLAEIEQELVAAGKILGVRLDDGE